jgi:T-complex protein 1 subunit theta
VDNVRVAKIMGSGVLSSKVVRGMLFKRSVESYINHCTDAKIAVYTAPLDAAYTETKGTVLLNTAEELKSFSQGEESLLEGQLKAIKDTGATVIVTGGKVGDMALHFCNRLGMMVVKLTSKFDLQRLCRATRATALPKLLPPEPQELGFCSHVSVEEIGDTTVTVFRQEDVNSAVSTVVVRGATANMMDDVERAVDDAVNNYKAITKDGRFVPGAGACEIELARQIAKYGETCPGLEQYAINSFAEALEVVPATLAENCGVKQREIIASLYAAHENGQANAGIDVESETPSVINAHESKIWDNYLAKSWGLKYATQAACTVLRVDQIIMAKRAGGPKAQQNPAAQAER